jgi:2-iminobutanoate/2-iminopropanoate deaminase
LGKPFVTEDFSMQKKIIATTAAPAAIGPYSQAVSANGFLYLSGMLAIDPGTGSLAGEDAPAQAKQILKNISALLASEGLAIENVIKTTVFLTDLAAFSAVNAVYGVTFASNPPARSCVEVSRLPKDALVEIECVAVY